MANNSFLLKGWTIVLVSALFALAAKDTNKLYIYLCYFPAVSFWILDGYFLRQERLYRKLYDKVRIMEESKIDFSMDISSLLDEVDMWGDVVLSKTLSMFHGSIIATVLVVMFISFGCN